MPPEWLEEIDEKALRGQFVRTPYAVSFRAENATFILVTLHVNCENEATERIFELQGTVRWMADWARRSNCWHHNLIALGDISIDRAGSDLWQAFIQTGLTVMKELQEVPRTIFSDEQNAMLEKFYNQIAWLPTTRGIPRLSIPPLGLATSTFCLISTGTQD